MRQLRVLIPSVWLLAACGGSRHGGGGASPAAGLPDAALVALRTQTADQQITHALSRLTFGARPGDAQRVRQIGVDRWIAQQLRPEAISDDVSETWLRQFQSINKTSGELEAETPNPALVQNQLTRDGKMSAQDSVRLRDARQAFRRLTMEVQVSHLGRALQTERQLQEVMTDFWLNHFTVFVGKGQREQFYLAEYENRVIRPRSLGKFRDLLGAVAKSPAMLFYLDNWESAADSTRPRLVVVNEQQAQRRLQQAMAAQGRRPNGRPLPPGAVGAPGAIPPQLAQQALQRRLRGGLNENYGRELLELHTLGVDGGYTQQDVINAARALTGWTIAGPRQGGGFEFAPTMHDAGEKVVLGHTLRGGRGIEDGEELLDIVARHPSTAHFIAYKLARRFVADTPPAALVERAAATFRRTDGDIRETVRVIVTSPEFFSREAYRAKLKTPFEVVVSALRAVNARPDTTPRTAQVVNQLGQPYLGHQTPNGWPETADGWLGTGAILNRINFGLTLAAGRVPGANWQSLPDAAALRAAPVAQQVDAAVQLFLGGDVSSATRAVLVEGKNPLLDRAPADATMAGPPPIRLTGFANIVGLALGSPEFQRR